MISDRTLTRVALVLAIIGIAGLFLVTLFIGPKEIKIGSITDAEIGMDVTVKGVVDSYYEKDGHVFIDLNDTTGTIKAVVFENTAKGMPTVYNIEQGDMISIEGKVQLYKNELEIVATAVKTFK